MCALLTGKRLRAVGRPRVLGEEDERAFIEYARSANTPHEMRTISALRSHALDFRRNQNSDTTRTTPPSLGWAYAVLGRHDMTTVAPRALASERFINPDVVCKWLEVFRHITEDSEFTPHLLFNLDETALELSHGRPLRIAATLNEQRPIVSAPRGHNEHITYLPITNAAGFAFPKILLLSGVLNFVPESAQENLTRVISFRINKGWMKTEIFYDIIMDYLTPAIRELRTQLGIPHAPAWILTDGHISRYNPYLLRALRNNNINLFIFPPHSTHLLQPLDVGVFAPLKQTYKRLLRGIMHDPSCTP